MGLMIIALLAYMGLCIIHDCATTSILILPLPVSALNMSQTPQPSGRGPPPGRRF
jgi:hypothetical protein